MFLLLLLLVAFGSGTASAGGKCNKQDAIIYKAIGHTFPTLFRTFAGLWVSQAEYEVRIQEVVKLSAPCSQCYGDAYTCGWNNCKRACIYPSSTCDQCLFDYGCSTACNACTHFLQ